MRISNLDSTGIRIFEYLEYLNTRSPTLDSISLDWIHRMINRRRSRSERSFKPRASHAVWRSIEEILMDEMELRDPNYNLLLLTDHAVDRLFSENNRISEKEDTFHDRVTSTRSFDDTYIKWRNFVKDVKCVKDSTIPRKDRMSLAKVTYRFALWREDLVRSVSQKSLLLLAFPSEVPTIIGMQLHFQACNLKSLRPDSGSELQLTREDPQTANSRNYKILFCCPNSLQGGEIDP